MEIIKKVDFFRKVQEDISTTSSSGGAYSIIGIFLAIVLFIKEFNLYREPIIQREFVVSPLNANQITCYLNITFFNAPCNVLSLDYQDENGGELGQNIGGKNMKKVRISSYGDIITQEFGNGIQDYINSEQEMTDLHMALKNNEMCRYEGKVLLKKSPGNIHFSFHTRQELIDNLKIQRQDLFAQIKLDHQINQLHFGNFQDGETIEYKDMLGEKLIIQSESRQEQILKKYFQFTKTEQSPYNKIVFLGDQKFDYENYIKVLPLKFEFPNIGTRQLKEIESVQELYQFSMASTKIPKQGNEMTSVYFRYEVSPLNLIYSLSYQKTYHFIVQILAIIGGVLAVIGIISSTTQELVTFINKQVVKTTQ